MEFVKPPKLKELDFRYKDYDEWLVQHERIQKYELKGSANWCSFFVQQVDYLANPAITVKNQSVIDSFIE